MTQHLTTSLAEIRSLNPCSDGLNYATNAVSGSEKDFNIIDYVTPNSVNYICWLLGKRKNEIQICVKFARLCADSVAHLTSSYAANAAAAAANAEYSAANAEYAAANAADAAHAANDTAAHATNAADYAAAAAAADYVARAHTYAAAADAYAAAADADAYAAAYAACKKQEKLNAQFLIQAIQEWETEHLSTQTPEN